MGAVSIIVTGLALLLAGEPGHSRQSPSADPLPDLAPTLKCTALLRPNQDVTVSVNIENKGQGPAPESDFDVIVKNGHAPREVAATFKRKIRALDPGDHFSYTFKIQVALGLYEICGTCDRKKKIPDADRKNNSYCIMLEGK